MDPEFVNLWKGVQSRQVVCTQQLSNGTKIRVPRGTPLGLNLPLASAARARTTQPCGRWERGQSDWASEAKASVTGP